MLVTSVHWHNQYSTRMNTSTKQLKPTNVFGVSDHLNFRSNKQLIDMMMNKDNSKSDRSSTCSNHKHTRLHPIIVLPNNENKQKRLKSSQKNKPSSKTKPTLKLNSAKDNCALANKSEYCHHFQENMNSFYKFQEISKLINSIKEKSKHDSYSFHKIFDVLQKHCYHNRKLINDLKNIWVET